VESYKSLKVFSNQPLVGTLAITEDNFFAFEYDAEWLGSGYSKSYDK